MRIKLSVLENAYHRNGVAGDGFEVFKARCDGQSVLITIGYKDDSLDDATCRVLDPLDLENRFRGDVIADALFLALQSSGNLCRKCRYYAPEPFNVCPNCIEKERADGVS